MDKIASFHKFIHVTLRQMWVKLQAKGILIKFTVAMVDFEGFFVLKNISDVDLSVDG